MLVRIIGIPVAWAISNREDANTFKVVFNAVKTRCPSAAVNTVMTDDGKIPQALLVRNKPINALRTITKAIMLQLIVYTTTHRSSRSFCYHGMLPKCSSPTLPLAY